MIFAAIGIFVAVSADITDVATFSDADQLQQVVKVTGELAKDQPIEYDPQVDANYLSFFMKDSAGEVRKVIMNAAKPQDFERSESIVVTGKSKGNLFEATDMLLKCPSKYKDEVTFVKAKQKASRE